MSDRNIPSKTVTVDRTLFEEAISFVDRHSESWYRSGQDLLARLRAVQQVETGGEQREDRAYYNGARQAAAMAHQSLQAMDEWINSGCGGRGPSVKSNENPEPSASTDDNVPPSRVPPPSSVECPECRTQLAFEGDVCGLCNPVAQP